MPQLPLSELRVVEIGSGDALGYCGKLFADFGADVIKVEPSGGDAARKIATLVDAGNGRHESGYFAWLNTNKRSLSADLDRPAGVAKVRALLESADLLLDARHPTVINASPLSHENIRRSQPGLAITAISWFGERGPYRDYAVTDSVCRSLAGLVKLVGPIEGPPVLPRDGQIGVVAGLTAFIPSLAGLYARDHQGARRFAVSALEAMLQISEFDTALALESGFTRPRIGINRFGRGFPVGNFATKDGWLGVTVVTPAQWVAFCNMIGLPELGPDPRYSATAERYLHAEELNGIIKPVLMHRTAMEWFQKGIELRLPLAIVPDMRELLTQPVFRERGTFAEVTIGSASFDAPVLPQHLTRSPPRPNGRSPLAGEDDDAALPAHRRLASRAATADDPLPLKGRRIIDLTMGWAGPTATRQMGDLGADIIKVESCQYPDWFRGTDPRGPYHPERTYEKTYWFQMNNRNKRGITLDLTTETGLTLLKRLIRDADAVIDNYASWSGRCENAGDQSTAARGDDAGLWHDGRVERLPRLWLDAGASLGAAFGDGTRGRPADDGSCSAWRSHRRAQCGCRADARLHASEEYRRRSAHRPQPGRMHAAAGGAVDHRTIRHRQIQRPDRQPPPGLCAERLLSLYRRRPVDHPCGTKRRGVAIALPHHASP